jgi:hypothetical protein
LAATAAVVFGVPAPGHLFLIMVGQVEASLAFPLQPPSPFFLETGRRDIHRQADIGSNNYATGGLTTFYSTVGGGPVAVLSQHQKSERASGKARGRGGLEALM